jgi:transposase InsO family protein
MQTFREEQGKSGSGRPLTVVISTGRCNTFIWTGQGWFYLAVVMDLYSRRIM